ncbi:MAG: ABC transporter substrate-binding protein [Bradyrhizobium sp.]
MNSPRNKWSVLLAATILHVAAASSAQAQTVAIGAIVPSSGPFAEWGRSNTVTLKMLEQEVNKAGGINGAKLKVIILDDATKPAQAASSLRKLAGDEKVIAVAGPLTSSAAEVTFPVANEMKVVSMSQASSKPGVAKANRPWAFRNTIDESILAKSTVPYFKKTFDIKTVAIIFDAKDATAATVGTKIMPGMMKENGITIVNETDPLSFNTGDLDVSAQVTKIKSLNPDGVVLKRGLQPGSDRAARNEAPGVHQAGGRRDAADLFGDSQSGAGTSDCRARDLLCIDDRWSRRPPSWRSCNRCCARNPGCRRRSNPACMTRISTRSSACMSKPPKNPASTGKPEDLEADRTKVRDYLVKLDNFKGLGGPISFNDDGDAIKAFYVLQGQNGAWTTKVQGCSSVPGHPAC